MVNKPSRVKTTSRMTHIGVEASAISVLKRAVDYDQQRRYTSAVVCYQEGVQLLLDLLKMTGDEQKRQHVRSKIESYMDRAEEIKKLIEKEKEAGTFTEKFNIPDGARNYGYNVIMGQLLESGVRVVEVEDPYIMTVHQITNFIKFCEMLLLKCENLSKIKLTTKVNEKGSPAEQKEKLAQVSQSLELHRVQLEVVFSLTLHDREIRLDTGWVVKIGRGLDYFKPTPTKFSVGQFDLNLRECHETTVNIFHKKHLRSH